MRCSSHRFTGTMLLLLLFGQNLLNKYKLKHMNSLKISFTLLMALLLFTACIKDDNKNPQTSIKVSGIEFIPNLFLANGKVIGVDADIASQAMQNSGIDIEFSISNSWQDAYNATLTGPNKALLTTTYTPERAGLFKWAGPTSQGIYGIFEKGHSDFIFPLPIEECKKLPQIAAVKGWVETTTLEDLGFTNLVYYDTYNEALEAFMNDQVQFISSDFYHLTSTLPLGYYLDNVNAVTRYRTVYYYIAFSKDVSDAVVSKVQGEIETLIKNNSTGSIIRKYIPRMIDNFVTGTIQLFTEYSPPSSYGIGGGTSYDVNGSSIDILNKIMERTGYINKINLTLWNDGYAIAQYLPNSAIFATARTPERENMFQWVGPISTNRTFFYTLSGSGLEIQTIEQAKALNSIATPNGWFTHEFLLKNNFKNINATALTSEDAFKQLVNGEVEAVLLPEIDFKWLAETNKIPLSNLTQHLEAMDYNSYIAFSLSTPKSTVQQWQNILDQMKSDGTFSTIWNKWHSGVPMP